MGTNRVEHHGGKTMRIARSKMFSNIPPFNFRPFPDAILFNPLNFYRMEITKSDYLPCQGYNLETLAEFSLKEEDHVYERTPAIVLN
jgi:hypothetical protein